MDLANYSSRPIQVTVRMESQPKSDAHQIFHVRKGLLRMSGIFNRNSSSLTGELSSSKTLTMLSTVYVWYGMVTGQHLPK